MIHVVRPGDSIFKISRQYGIDPNLIIERNELRNPEKLVIGQTLFIPEVSRRHQVLPGESLYMIASDYGVTVRDILEVNPEIANEALIYPGMVITIPPRVQKLGSIEVNGYAFPNINFEVLNKTLPYLTYLSIFSYQVTEDGNLIGINDEPLIDAARMNGVAPLMVITNLKEGGGFSSDIARAILKSEEVQETLLNNIINTLEAKNYYGLDIDFEYIYPEDREDYNNFLRKTKERLNEQGYILTTALAPKISSTQKGILYEAHDYPVHGEVTDHVILMTYEWGYTYGPPLAVAPINEIRKVLDYAVTEIPSEKIFMGIPNYGYDWKLPYVEGTAARTVTNVGAVELALREGATIEYDEVAQAPYFNYTDDNNVQHVVWFEDARSIEAKLKLVNEYGLGGVSYWTINRFFPQNWLVLESMYDIIKVL